MSHHLDRKEFDEAVRDGEWDLIWSAYEYAVNGGESTKFEIELSDIGDLVGMMVWGMRHAEASLDNDEGCEYHDKSLEDRAWIASKRIADGLSAAGNLINRIHKYIPSHYLGEEDDT